MKPSISFIIPAYNEEGHLRTAVVESCRVLSLEVDDFEIIIVNDGSQDQTPEIAEQLAKEDARICVLHNERNMGFGFTCQKGIDASRKDFIGWVSADTTWQEETLVKIIRML